MNAVVDLAEARRMTPADYERERAEIRATYGDTAGEAAALRDQALANLFYRSGWTLEALAEKEHCRKSQMSRRMLFGRFLGSSPTGGISRNLSERKFRDYWERTDKSETNERIRFREVLKLMESSETSLPRRFGLGAKIRDKFSDGKWHDIETIAQYVEQPPETLRNLLFDFAKTNNNYGVGLCEKRQHGKAIQYRMRKAGRRIDLDVLMEELQPIIDGLKVEGRKNQVTAVPSIVAGLAVQLERLIEKLVKQSAGD